MLYYATLRYNFQRGDREVDTRLLYSRYEASRGLLAVNYYRTLLREALKLRNQIVATELLIARDGFSRILPLLNADTIYKDVPRDGYFHRYVLPELSTLNAQLSTLNSIERLYVERMMTFVYREQVAARLGSSEQRLHHSSGAASDLWLMPLDEKLETGNIYLGLTIAETQRTAPDGGYDLRFELAIKRKWYADDRQYLDPIPPLVVRDYASRGAWVSRMCGGSVRNPEQAGKGIPIDLSFALHSDAGVTPNDSIVGTLAIYTLLCEDEDELPEGVVYAEYSAYEVKHDGDQQEPHIRT